MREAVGQVKPYFAVIAFEAHGLLVAELVRSDCDVALEGEDWNWEGWCCG